MSGLTPEIVMQLMEAGESQSAIARTFKVSRQYVHKLAKQGGHKSENVGRIVTDNLPWEVPTEWQDGSLYYVIRLLAHYNSGLYEISPSSLERVNALVKRLKLFQQVIDYDPRYPAVKGLSSKPGFAYVPRTPEDEGMAIKIRPGIRLTDEGRKLWAMPKELPESI
ncbi:helix-turn-helix domain-containing protein [Corynebacterium uterequi]|uniref:Homeodomain-like domain n=1 Tax=Corynebacterium uterequi TaxID=1072256 RepID=A0A0G3HCH2_9CORY|nr:hypothetical protein [Corynebacterium uterequi]AKK11091.1 hypothetical protein CUTER_05470 [Corynebacterium uterequi]